jgi:hypothetical protein
MNRHCQRLTHFNLHIKKADKSHAHGNRKIKLLAEKGRKEPSLCELLLHALVSDDGTSEIA